MMNVHAKVNQYIEHWKRCGYSDDIPDEVPEELYRAGLAPSYKAIAVAILKNDVPLKSLGFSGEHSDWYDALKRQQFEATNPNGRLF